MMCLKLVYGIRMSPQNLRVSAVYWMFWAVISQRSTPRSPRFLWTFRPGGWRSNLRFDLSHVPDCCSVLQL